MCRPRIASLCPSNTEMIHYLGYSSCLIAVDNYSDYPEDIVSRLPRLGPDLHIDIDKLTQLKPDLVVASLSVPGMERVVEALKQTGLSYIVLNPTGLDEIFRGMLELSDAILYSKTSSVRRCISDLQYRVERIQYAAQQAKFLPNLYWEWWPNPIFSPAQDNWLTEISRLAGARNIFEHQAGSQVKDDGQMVIAENPDYLLAVWTGVAQSKVPIKKILSRSGWDRLNAFVHRQIYVLSEGLFCRPSPRLVDGLEQLFGLLHPRLATQLNLPAPYNIGPIRNAQGVWLGGRAPA